MPLIDTSQLSTLSPDAALQIYCGLDSCISFEARIAEEEYLAARPYARLIYNFEKALQAPYLEIMLRGFAVNQLERHRAIRDLTEKVDFLKSRLDALAEAMWDTGLNPRSHKQLKEFFYDRMKLPERWTSKKGVKKLSLDRTALEYLYDHYTYSRPFINHILSIRDLSKQLEVLDSEIDSDGRFRTSYNIAGTETGRPSSSTNAFGTGGNAQNIAPGLRHIFISDPGYKLLVVDLEQAEARDVGFLQGCLFDDWTYLDTCERGDLHTNNARLVWPELGWTGSDVEDRRMAGNNFYREFSYRDMAKRGSHLSNYMGTAWTMARSLKIPQQVAEDFQARYNHGPACAFLQFEKWWQWTAQQIQTTYKLVTPFGRERHFFGRPDDDATLREAIAFQPQSMTTDRLKLGLWRVWKHLPEVQLLGDGYDALIAQVSEEMVDDLLPHILELMRVPLYSTSNPRRLFVVPGEAKVGWNWGAYSPNGNPGGLIKWAPGKDTRSRPNIF